MRKTVSVAPDLWATFLAEWKKRGTTNASKAIQAAMRLWLTVEAGKENAAGIGVPAPPPSKSGWHYHVTLPDDFGKAIETHARRRARTAPDLFREALAIYIRQHGTAPEFKGLEEWRFLGDDTETRAGEKAESERNPTTSPSAAGIEPSPGTPS